MPVFNNPRQAIIIQGGGLGAVLPIAGALLAIAAVVAFIAAHRLLSVRPAWTLAGSSSGPPGTAPPGPG